MTTSYPVLCAWCLKLGRDTVVNYTTIEHSHGICQPCAEQVYRELEAFKARGKV